MLEICIFSAVFLVTYFGIRWFRLWTLKRGVLDLPNERSSHETPTPRGGGLVLALVVIMAYAAGSLIIGYEISIGFLIGSILIVVISWLDDVYTVSFALRLLIHIIAAGAVIYSSGYVSSIPSLFGTEPIPLGVGGAVLTFGWLIWMINSYNFMDGIDGIAGLQAVTASVGWLLVTDGNGSVYFVAGAVLFASSAFLLHNWPPARIFMGDSGSAFLGFVFASLPLMAIRPDSSANNLYFLAAVSFVWLFVFDSVFTFCRRALSREKVWQAHREHLYQRLVRSGWSHRATTLLYGGISTATVLAVAWLTVSGFARPVLAILSVLSAGSLIVVMICWKRKCLFGDVS